MKILYKYRYWFYIGVLCLISMVLFWKCKYGYATLDEAFYPTIAYRFLQGDRILFDEWSNTQLSAVVIMPFLKFYMFFTGGLDGIYLYIRYCYTAIKIVISLFIFIGMRKYSEAGAFFASALFLIFSGYGLMVLSYNTISIAGTLLFLLCLLTSDDSVMGWLKRILAGIFLSMSVLGIPYVAILYILYVIAVFVISKMKIKNQGIADFYSPKALLGVTVGVGISAIIFLIYVLSNTTIQQIINTIPHILHGDPAHPKKNLYQMTLAYMVRIAIGNHHNYWVFGIYLVITLICVLFLFRRKKVQDRELFISVSGCVGILLLITYILTNNYINDVVFVPNVVAAMIFIFTQNRKIQELFACVWVPGMVFTYLEYIASNTGYAGISCASCVACVGSITIIFIAMKEELSLRKKQIPLLIFCLFTIISCFVYRCTYVFWEDGGLPSLTEQIEGGVADGLMVTENTAKHYYAIMSDTEVIRKLPEDTRVLYIGDQVLWMSGKQKCASYSPLCYSISADRSILYDYYEEHPEMTADIVYVEETYGIEVVEDIVNTLGYTYTKGEAGWILTAR